MDSTTLNVSVLPGRPSVHRFGRLVDRRLAGRLVDRLGPPIGRPADCGLALVADPASRLVVLRHQPAVVLDLFLCRLPFLFLLFLNQMKLDWVSDILSPGPVQSIVVPLTTACVCLKNGCETLRTRG